MSCPRDWTLASLYDASHSARHAHCSIVHMQPNPVFVYIAVLFVAMTSALECTSGDLATVTSAGLTCINAASLNIAAVSSQDPEVLVKMCQHSECKSFFAATQALTCTVQNQPASLASLACSGATSWTPTITLGVVACLVLLVVQL
ncbi:hypothetical protein SDRG_09017 [Saprolegnia diclina VS20]|uniref:Elicitin n=1 Tax=Saprolegnia diclina (strain VS20) TaxID=1156394 RepID=T0Q6Q1_SAPDV|nr:hypothetical protein SDRG_09017 [Saprolegnia diclina VS20]EQC33509.1 hypothetical protein SDRG_09017 [Saprolegnia diclina VS20]|eukprot:XP_008613149.1 hypothetical protein SDRG_09017 [Saprolegnia diclina VS20]